jgi:hypothetical protein
VPSSGYLSTPRSHPDLALKEKCGMSLGGYRKTFQISTIAAAAVLIAVAFASRAPALATSSGLGADLSLGSTVKLVLTKKQMRMGQKPKDPPGTCTRRDVCSGGFIYIQSQCLNCWSVRQTQKRC